MVVRIIKRISGVYDVYNCSSGEWIFSRIDPDNVFLELSKLRYVVWDFIDEEISRKMT